MIKGMTLDDIELILAQDLREDYNPYRDPKTGRFISGPHKHSGGELGWHKEMRFKHGAALTKLKAAESALLARKSVTGRETKLLAKVQERVAYHTAKEREYTQKIGVLQTAEFKRRREQETTPQKTPPPATPPKVVVPKAPPKVVVPKAPPKVVVPEVPPKPPEVIAPPKPAKPKIETPEVASTPQINTPLKPAKIALTKEQQQLADHAKIRNSAHFENALIDMKRGSESPADMTYWTNRAFKDTDPILRDAAVIASQRIQMNNRRSGAAYYAGSGHISMKGYTKEDNAAARITAAHEFGHALDNSMGMNFSSKSGFTQRVADPMEAHDPYARRTRFFSSQATFRTAMQSDNVQLLNSANSASHDKLPEGVTTDSRHAKNYRDMLLKKHNYTQSDLEEAIAYADSQGFHRDLHNSPIFHAKIMHAIEHKDAHMFADEIFSRTRNTPKGMIESGITDAAEYTKYRIALIKQGTAQSGEHTIYPIFSDMIGCSTSNRILGHYNGQYGHDNKYLRNSENGPTEVFAQMTAFRAQAHTLPKIMQDLPKLFMPATHEVYNRGVAEFAKQKETYKPFGA